MPRFLKTVLSTGIPFGLWMGLFSAFRNNWNAIALLFVIFGSGLVFGLCMAVFNSVVQTRQSAPPRFHAEEYLLKSEPANHFLGPIAMGGRLFLTNRSLIFQAHAFLQKPYKRSFQLADIVRVQPSMTLWVVPNGLAVWTRQGKSEHFVVEQRNDWCEALKSVHPELIIPHQNRVSF